ncbi:FeoB-associated Cys-rich membrane protein [uncultured Megasphaera sp.]|uniref:FeoB-associated Cys-rich membrane protein n=1 Tax=uncultured Megasphaera sp. TaxID=165188 RepID=UPI0025938999|nr:FeoB-associated Cys-rich membrane protein [uncultured Megasphaera sp.]
MDITTIIVGIVVLIAAFYIGRHVRGLFKGTASCCGSSGGGCSGCSGGCAPKPKK